MPLHYRTIPVTPFAQNASLVFCDATRKAALIDPGGDLPQLLAAVDELGVELEQIWLTHAHIDHAGGAGELARTRGLPIVGPHPGDKFWIDALAEQSRMFGFAPAEAFTPTRWLADGDRSRSANARSTCAIAPATRQGTWSFTACRHSAPSSATCCSPAASAAPTFRAVTSTR